MLFSYRLPSSDVSSCKFVNPKSFQIFPFYIFQVVSGTFVSSFWEFIHHDKSNDLKKAVMEKIHCYDKSICLTVKSMSRDLIKKRNLETSLSNRILLSNTFRKGKNLHKRWLNDRDSINESLGSLSVCLEMNEYSTSDERIE